MGRTMLRKWWRASVDFLGGFGCGFGTKMFYVYASTERNARKRIKDIVGWKLYDLGSAGNRGINGLTEMCV